MNRAISLTRIHAVNWFGYNDSLPVNCHLLLAGVTGSGKSVLMDLIQLVLVGSERALFNRSATGTTGDRTLKSYLSRIKAAAVHGGSVAPFSRDDLRLNEELLTLLPTLLAWEGESLIRFASCVLCGDSK